MGRVLVVGSSNTDLVARADRLPSPSETVLGRDFATFPGGKGANQAVAAARAGASVVFIGAVGDDDFGTARRDDLRAENVDVSRVEVIKGMPSGVALIVVDEAGQNQIVVAPGANGMVGPGAAAAGVQHVEHDVLSLTLEIPFDTVAAAVRSRKHGTQVVLNAAPFDPRVADLVPMVDVLIVNEVEARALLGREVTLDSAFDAAQQIQRRGCSAGIVTLGPAGAVVGEPGRAWLATAPRVSVVDTTGAGDAFCGALAAWLSHGQPIEVAVQAGVAAGSIAVTREGAQSSLPRRDEIERDLSLMPDLSRG